jgi:Flp pilus assembly pilin Flp
MWPFRGQAVSWRGGSKHAPWGNWTMKHFLGRLWSQEEGQDIAEYAVMLAVILVIVVGTVRLIGSNSNNVFSSVASSIGG